MIKLLNTSETSAAILKIRKDGAQSTINPKESEEFKEVDLLGSWASRLPTCVVIGDKNMPSDEEEPDPVPEVEEAPKKRKKRSQKEEPKIEEVALVDEIQEVIPEPTNEINEVVVEPKADDEVSEG